MSIRALITTAASTLLALALLASLIIFGHVDASALLRKLTQVRLTPFLVLVLATGVHVLLAAEKWRLVEMRLTGGAHLPRKLSFAYTALGTAAGQVLPIQVATALARSLGSRFLTGKGAVRSTLATLFEQGFDVLAIACCGFASLYCIWVGSLSQWPLLAALLVILGWWLTGPVSELASRVSRRLAGKHWMTAKSIGHLLDVVVRARLIERDLARHLFAISSSRYVVLCLMAAATSQAAGLDVPTIRLAAALPLVVFATALALTPAGIGVNEWSIAAALTAFGTDFQTAAEWALMNRILIACASLLVGAAGGIVAYTSRPAAAPPDAASAAGYGAGALAVPSTTSVPQDNRVR